MLLLSPFSPFTAAKIVGLQATVLLLITLLIKAQVQIKAASALAQTTKASKIPRKIVANFIMA